MDSSSSSNLPHIAIFPFMAKGHTIPLLHLAHLLHHRRLVSHITFFTTPLNAPFIRSTLSSTAAQNTSIIALPFPDNLPHGIHPGIESTDQLPSIDLLIPFVTIIPCLQPAFSQAISCLSPHPSLLISDAFLGWTQYVAAELVRIHKPHAEVSSSYEPFAVPGFTHLTLTKADLEPPFDDPDPKGPHWDFIQEQMIAATKDSRGFVVNSFYNHESPYFDCMDSMMGGNSYPVGPLCLARLEKDDKNQPLTSPLLHWLDSRLSA